MKYTLRILFVIVAFCAYYSNANVVAVDNDVETSNVKEGGEQSNTVEKPHHHHKHHHHHHNSSRHHKHHHHHHRPKQNGRVALSDYDAYIKQRRARQRVDQPDNWEKIPFLFQTYNEPDNYYQMPVLSNGYIGTTVKNDSLYVNGLYNGLAEKSHRIRIPSLTAIEASMVVSDRITYNFDCRKGVYTIETRNNKAIVTQRFYAHRSKRNLMVTEIKVELLVNDVVQIQLHNMTQLDLNYHYIDAPENPNKYSYYRQKYNPENLSFEQRVIKEPTYVSKIEQNDGTYYMTQRINVSEITNKRQKEIHMYYTNIPNQIIVNQTNKVFHFVQSVDSDMNRARSAYEDAMNSIKNDQNSLFVSHTSAWEDIWTKHGFAMPADGNFGDANSESFKLAQRLYSSFYNIYAAIPSSATETQFYGLSPAGLAYGGLKSEFYNSTQGNGNRHYSEAYGGHIMYNQELWILPLVSMFSYDMSKLLIQSRVRRGLNSQDLNVYEQARELARAEGLDGLRYPYEQGDFGIDVSPYQDARKSKIHTSGDISFGIKSYLRMSQNRDFLAQAVSNEVSVRGEDFLNEIAKYWAGKLKLESASNQYEIKTVSFGERPQSREIDNEGFTNCLAVESLKTYKYLLQLSDRNPYDSTYSYVTNDYDTKISRVKMPYDTSRQLYLEYDGFSPSNQNEETFIPFLNYPIQLALNYQQKKSILDNYANQLATDGKNTPSYASFIIGHLELNEEQKAKDYMTRFASHFSEPFNVLSEYPQKTNVVNPINTFHYLPGYAAFIHTFIAGYSGIRPRDFQLDIVYPTDQYTGYSTPSVGAFNVFKQPAQNLESWNITGLTYRGSKLDIIYNLRSKSVEIRNRRSTDTSTSADDSLEVITYEGTEAQVKPLKVGDTVMISLTTDQWTYAAKKSRLQKSNGYTENMHVLASIYSKNYATYLKRPSSASFLKVAPSVLCFLFVVYYKLVRFVS